MFARDAGARDDRADKVIKEIKELYGRQYPRFTFERILNANNGVAMIIRETLASGEQRKFVLKAAANSSDEMITNEIRWLQRLQYAEHVSNLIVLKADPLRGWEPPYFITEYLPHGTLRLFQERMQRANQTIPNRILWSIFACLVRGCIAMAYPPRGPYIQLEDVRDEEPLSLAHNDMHGENFVFGILEKARLLSIGGTMYLHEHAFLPPLKLIDFGLASDHNSPIQAMGSQERFKEHDQLLELEKYRQGTGRRNEGTDYNILDIGFAMCRLLSPSYGASLQQDVRIWVRNPNIRPGLDPNLVLLLQRCVAVDPLNRPRLEELHTMLNNGGFSKSANSYLNQAGQVIELESDETLRRIVVNYILSADTN